MKAQPMRYGKFKLHIEHFKKSLRRSKPSKSGPCRTKIIPFDLVLLHEEKWLYPDPDNAGNKLPSGEVYKEVLLYQKEYCIMSRFPYFNQKYLEIPDGVWANLKQAHKALLKE